MQIRAATGPAGMAGPPHSNIRSEFMLREQFSEMLKNAIRSKDTLRMATLRLIQAAVKDRDIANRGQGKDPVSDEEILGILTKMIKQREESAKIYEENARLELAQQEREEISVIQEFLPAQLTEDKMRELCATVVSETGANGLRDMGKCMSTLKERYPGQMDFGKASCVVKGLLQ